MTTPPEALREMGADFIYAADALTATMRHLEQGRDALLKKLRDCITDETSRLAKLKEEVRTLPEQIAKWEAERARLESQTGLDLLRAVVAERGENPREPSPNRFDCEECGTGVSADEDGCCATCGRACWQWVNGDCVLAGGAEPEEMPSEPPTGELAYTAKTPGRVLVNGKAEQAPALLDLRGLKVGTTLRFDADSSAGRRKEHEVLAAAAEVGEAQRGRARRHG